MPCPDGLIPGFGLPEYLRRSVCLSRSYFGKDRTGLGVYLSGTAFLIETDAVRSILLTAAHNVYHPGLGRAAEWVDCYFGRSGDSSAASRQMRSARYPDEFDDDSTAPESWDFAAIRVNPVDPGRFTPIPLRESSSPNDTEKIIVGYPAEGACQGTFRPFHAMLTVFPSSPVNYKYRAQQTYVGLSGAPLLTTTEPYGAFGLHIRGGAGHRAVRFTRPVLNRISAWLQTL